MKEDATFKMQQEASCRPIAIRIDTDGYVLRVDTDRHESVYGFTADMECPSFAVHDSKVVLASLFVGLCMV